MQHHHSNMTSPPQQFCLRWNNYQSNLTNVFDQLLQSEAFVDVTLACDGHSVKAHKMVLSACSPYFQTLFFENPCRHPIVILKDIKWPELKAAVEFMYRGEINVLQEQIGPLLKVAETLKIRGLADVNNEMDNPASVSEQSRGSPVDSSIMTASPNKLNNNIGSSSHHNMINKTTSLLDPRHNALDARFWRTDLHDDDPIALKVPVSSSSHRKKRRRASGGERSTCSSASSPEEIASNAASLAAAAGAAHMELLESVAAAGGLMEPAVAAAAAAAVAAAAAAAAGLSPPSGNGDHCRQPPGTPDLPPPSLPLPPPPPPSMVDDMEIKPGIAEMILEEERAKLLESSHAWLGASTSSINADSYQYQLQSMWQKCWNTNQSLVHNLRFRERGPLKSWRPETMAEAIFSVLKEGLSLSQAARKYDIPYPTFVLYANRVHNMLGPSADGGADLRPKGRGRPQRILLGVWPEEHIRGVIRAVVFRDPQHIKEEAQSLARLYCLQDPLSQSPQGYSSSTNGGHEGGGSRSETPTPGSAAAAAVAAVAQGLRQQMCGLAAGGEGGSQQGPSAAAAAAALASAILSREAVESMQAGASLNNNTLTAMMNNGIPGGNSLRMAGLGLGNIGVSGMTYKPGMFAPPRPENLFQEDIEDIVKSPLDHVDSMDESDSIQQVKPEPGVMEASVD